MSLLLSEEVLKYREKEVDVCVRIMKKVLATTDAGELQKCSGMLEAVKQIINLPKEIASTPEEKLYANELIGKTRDLLASKIAEKYLFE